MKNEPQNELKVSLLHDTGIINAKVSFAVSPSLVKLPWQDQLLLSHKADKNFVANKATYLYVPQEEKLSKVLRISIW